MDDTRESTDRDGRDAGSRSGSTGPVPPALLEHGYVFDVLAHPRRRLVCALLAAREEWNLDDLAAAIAAREAAATDAEAENESQDDAKARNESQVGGDDEHALEAVRISLAHHHIPTLATWGVVEYDEREGRLRRGERAHVIRSVLAGIAAVVRVEE